MSVSIESAAHISTLMTEKSCSPEMSVQPNNLHTVTSQLKATFSVY
jgi:hypothetical protein